MSQRRPRISAMELETIPVTASELIREALRVINKPGMPDDGTYLAELIVSFLGNDPEHPSSGDEKAG